ncbi:MAG TPA: hypothetical protein VM099_13820 [Gemmatimonadaceae bacterium]|nr:hypothetical protein [Gemmatimonadaceae bacterium]
MRIAFRRANPVLLGIAVLIIGCHHQPPKLLAERLPEEHCWWAVMRSPMPLDSVAESFARSFRSVGLTGVSSKRIADSVWVSAGPTFLAQRGGGTYASRFVGYWDGTNTHFRQFVSFVASPGDTIRDGRTIPFCGATAGATGVIAVIPHEPTGEESLPLWTRIPGDAK